MFIHKFLETDTAKQCSINVNDILDDDMGTSLKGFGIFKVTYDLVKIDIEVGKRNPFSLIFMAVVTVPFLLYIRYDQNKYLKKAKKKYPELFL